VNGLGICLYLSKPASNMMPSPLDTSLFYARSRALMNHELKGKAAWCKKKKKNLYPRNHHLQTSNPEFELQSC